MRVLPASVIAFFAYAIAASALPPDVDPPLDDGPISPLPRNLALVSATESQIRLQFQCGGNADVHITFRQRDGEAGPSVLSSTQSCTTLGTVVDQTVQPETRYCYFVRAANTTHQAQTSALCVEAPAPTAPPAAPTVWLTTRFTNQIAVIYRDNASNENYFQVHRRRVGDPVFTVVSTVNRAEAHRAVGGELQFSDSGLTTDTLYEYFVQAGYQPSDPFLPALESSSPVVTGRTRPTTVPSAAGACLNVDPDDCKDTLTLFPGMDLAFYSNYDIAANRSAITRAVLVVHGLSRNAQSAYNAMFSAASTSNMLGETLIVAPLFDSGQWGGGWSRGDLSSLQFFPFEPPFRISSFAAADALVFAMTDGLRFPNLREVVIAGHSAGGQFTQRYAATSRVQASRPGLRFRYVVANPSSYMYLNDKRPTASGGFVVPNGCSGYDDYKYGLTDRNHYTSQLTVDEIRNQYRPRYVIYLLGDLDTFNEGNLDTSCRANVQGAHRFARGTFYHQHTLRYFPGNMHRRVPVPNVGHSSTGVYGSQRGKDVLFF